MTKLFSKILCPIDFDESSLAGLEQARDLAEGRDSTIYLFHVVPFIAAGEALVDYSMMEAEARDKLADLAREHLGDKVRYEVRTQVGDPAQAILHEIDRTGADSVVMATHGRTGVKRFLLGSVAERVVRESSRPVLTIRPAEHS
jgi:nucleotide-binding universal stress UspA family protein